MMTDWEPLYENLPDEEKDKIAILRVMECTNGIIQHAYRDGDKWALPVDETRKAMKFSMGCIKRMQIPLKEETITFAPETQELMRSARQFYIDGVKKGDDGAFAEFMAISAVTARVVGKERIERARDILAEQVDQIPPDTLQWGVDYLMQFF